MTEKRYVLKSNLLRAKVESDSYDELLKQATDLQKVIQKERILPQYILISERVENSLPTKKLFFLQRDNADNYIWKDASSLTSNTVFQIEKNPFNKELFFNINEYPLLPNQDPTKGTYIKNGLVYTFNLDLLLSESEEVSLEGNQFFIKDFVSMEHFSEMLWNQRLKDTERHIEQITERIQNVEQDSIKVLFTDDEEDFFEDLELDGNRLDKTHLIFAIQSYIDKNGFQFYLDLDFVTKIDEDGDSYYKGTQYDDFFDFANDILISEEDGILEFEEIDNLPQLTFYTHSKVIPIDRLPQPINVDILLLPYVEKIYLEEMNELIFKLKSEHEILSKGFSYAYVNQNFL